MPRGLFDGLAVERVQASSDEVLVLEVVVEAEFDDVPDEDGVGELLEADDVPDEDGVEEPLEADDDREDAVGLLDVVALD